MAAGAQCEDPSSLEMYCDTHDPRVSHQRTIFTFLSYQEEITIVLGGYVHGVLAVISLLGRAQRIFSDGALYQLSGSEDMTSARRCVDCLSSWSLSRPEHPSCSRRMFWSPHSVTLVSFFR